MARTVFAWTIGVAYTLFWSALGILTWPLSPRGDLYLRYARIWSGWILATLRIPLHVTGRERLDPRATYLFMSNHESLFDIFALFRAIDHPFRMIAKRVLFFIPIFGWSLWMCGFVPINRSDRQSAIRSLDKAARRMRAGLSILVYPEGTRGPGGGRLLPFKKGVFHLAVEAGVPVVPVFLVGTDGIMPKGSRRVGRGAIEVRLGDPIDPGARSLAGVEALMAEVRAAMFEMGAGSVDPATAGP